MNLNMLLEVTRLQWLQCVSSCMTLHVRWGLSSEYISQIDQTGLKCCVLALGPSWTTYYCQLGQVELYHVWWDFDTDTFPPLSLLTYSHHGGILSWWEYAGKPFSSSWSWNKHDFCWQWFSTSWSWNKHLLAMILNIMTMFVRRGNKWRGEGNAAVECCWGDRLFNEHCSSW